MAKELKIRYTLQSGTLPNGLKLDPSTGVISGSAGFDALGKGPVWTGPQQGSLGSFDEGDDFPETTFQASSSQGDVRFSLATDQDRLPWGVVLDAGNGTLGGTIADLKLRVKEEASTSDGPLWGDQFGRLAGYDEGSTASLQLIATPRDGRTIQHYQIIDGYLPWGLVLNLQTGSITGVTDRLKTPGPFVDVPKLPLPVWSTESDLGTFNETNTFEATVSATPTTGRSMARYSLISGALPWGLVLNQATGQITGTFAEIKKRREPDFYDATKNPVISSAVNIQGVDTTKTAGSSLGTYAKGTTVSIKFSASAHGSRTIRNYWIEGALPFGLTINQITGEINGTITNNLITQVKTYSFTLWTSDQGGSAFQINKSSRDYTITVQ